MTQVLLSSPIAILAMLMRESLNQASNTMHSNSEQSIESEDSCTIQPKKNKNTHTIFHSTIVRMAQRYSLSVPEFIAKFRDLLKINSTIFHNTFLREIAISYDSMYPNNIKEHTGNFYIALVELQSTIVIPSTSKHMVDFNSLPVFRTPEDSKQAILFYKECIPHINNLLHGRQSNKK
jgi:hypothetical protein